MSFFTVDQINPKKLVEGVEIRVVPGDKMTMVFFRIEPGTEIPEHSHPHEQIGTVLSGSLELVIGGKKQVVDEGEAWHIPSDVVHSGRSLDATAEVLEVFAPPREDYVNP